MLTFILQGLQKEKSKKDGSENLFEEIITENFPNLEMETYLSPGSTKNSKQDKPRDSHTKTHYN